MSWDMFHSNDSRNIEMCDMYCVLDWHIFTWKIPNLGLIPHEVDYAVQSPLLHFENASWVLKMYLYGQTEYQTRDNIDFIIERLNSEVSSHDVICKMYFKNASNEEFNRKRFEFGFDSQWTFSRVHRFWPSPETPCLNDSLTLVFEFGVFVSNFQTKSVESTAGKQIYNKCYPRQKNGRNPEIGEIFNKYSAFKTFGLKLNISPPTPPGNYYSTTPTFSFGSASWIFKIFVCKEYSYKTDYHVVLERQRSSILEQDIMIEISSVVEHMDTVGSFLFTSTHTKQEVHQFVCNLGFHLQIKMKIKNAVIKTDIGNDSISRPAGVLRNLKRLFLSQEDADTIFELKGLKFPAHRLILQAQSPVFAAAFRNDMQEKNTGVIKLEDCDPSTFFDFLHFLYCAEIRKLSAENAFSLFAVADKYGVMELRSMCMEFIKLNLSVDTFYDTIALAVLHPDAKSELIELSTNFLAKNLEEIVASDEWKSFVVHNPELSKELLNKARGADV